MAPNLGLKAKKNPAGGRADGVFGKLGKIQENSGKRGKTRGNSGALASDQGEAAEETGEAGGRLGDDGQDEIRIGVASAYELDPDEAAYAEIFGQVETEAAKIGVGGGAGKVGETVSFVHTRVTSRIGGDSSVNRGIQGPTDDGPDAREIVTRLGGCADFREKEV